MSLFYRSFDSYDLLHSDSGRNFVFGNITKRKKKGGGQFLTLRVDLSVYNNDAPG